MSLIEIESKTIKTAVEIMASVSLQQQKKMLQLIKLEKTRSLAKKLDKVKPKDKKSDREITQMVHTIRKTYGRA